MTERVAQSLIVALAVAFALTVSTQPASAQGSFLKRGQEQAKEPAKTAPAQPGKPGAAPAVPSGASEVYRATLITPRVSNVRVAPRGDAEIIARSEVGEEWVSETRIRAADRPWLFARSKSGKAGYIAESAFVSPTSWVEAQRALASLTPVAVGASSGLLLINGQPTRLAGVVGRGEPYRTALAIWLRREAPNGANCQVLESGAARCFTPSGFDIAEAVLLNGAGDIDEVTAPQGYLADAARAARAAKRGVWAQ